MNKLQYQIVTIQIQQIMQQQALFLQNYSLDADIATGWKPKMKIIGPMPLNFDNHSLDNLIRPLIYSDTSLHEVIYLGLRPRDTFQMHTYLAKNYRFKFRHLLTTDYSHLKPFFRKFYSEFQPQCRLPFNGMNPKINSDILFESRFQSGNLDYVIRSKTNQYDLFLRIDSNTRGHIMWYYFKVTNKLDKLRTIRLNICNLRKSKAFYDKLMQPYVYRNGVGWKQQANKLSTAEDKVRFYRQRLIFCEDQQVQPQIYRKLSFDLELKPLQEVQISYGIPYTYSQLLTDIKQLKNQAKKNQNIQFDIDMSNISLSGLEIPYIKIYSKDERNQNVKKKNIFLIGRQHPGESNGSHVLKGFLQELVKSTQKQIRNLRKNFNFHVIPMLNPDGVVVGNFRTSLYGKDLNRLFRKNHTLMIPEIQFCKNVVFELTKSRKKKIAMFLDFHGHSFKRNAFCFAPSTFQTNSIQDVREFPKIISETTQMFRYPSCSFRISNQKKTTARAVFCRDTNLIYTIQASNWSYYSKQKKYNIQFTQKLFQQLGSLLLKSLGIYIIRANQTKLLSKKQRDQSKNEDLRIIQHNSSSLFKIRSPRKINLKTNQSLDQQKSINFIKRSQISNVSKPRIILPASTRQIRQISRNLNDNKKIKKQIEQYHAAQKSRIQTQIKDGQNAGSQDSDQSDQEDMDKQKFKKYINGATKMLIQFEKVYYGDQYNAKARYELPKKIFKKKQIPVIQQACLKVKHKSEKNTIQAEKNIGKIGYSDQKGKLKKREESMKKINFGMNQIQLPSKQQALKSLPRISIVNYLAYEQIDEKKILRAPKIQNIFLKNLKKVS